MKLQMKNWKLPFSFFLLTLAFGCSQNKMFKLAHEYYLRDKYVIAIEYYDRFITRTDNGALATVAELERSESYYQLGLKMYAKKKWEIAIRFFYLANSQKADEKMDNCYFELAKIAMKNNNIREVLKNYDYIVSNLPTSELIPEILYNRIKISVDLDDKAQAFHDYAILWEKYPQNDYTNKAKPFIDMLMPYYIEEVLALKDKGEYRKALKILKDVSRYPTSYKTMILQEIGEIYILMAEIENSKQNYQKTLEYFREAVKYNPDKKSFTEKRLREICDGFIKEGDKFIKQKLPDKAIEKYKMTFVLMPDYEKAVKKIEEANKLKENYKKAEELKQKALSFEKKKKYAEALKYYRESYKLMDIPEIKQKIFVMNNLVQAKKAPLEFAKSIILDYKNGIIPQKIYDIEDQMIKLYGENVRSSGWKVLYSYGEFKYEVRYDIITPKENYYFIWRVDLREKQIFPLNKLSEKMMGINKEKKK